MGTEDFSFPTITDVPRFVSSPTLWRVPSDISSDSFHEDDQKGEGGDSSVHKAEDCHQYNWLHSIGIDVKRASEEEKMDKLWENFNDEIHRISSFDRKKNVGRLCDSGGLESDSDVAGDAVELCCVQALKISKNSNSMLSPRRPSVLVIFKVLKKLFLIQNSHCPRRGTSSV